MASVKEKVVIMVSVTGHRGYRELAPYLPSTPEEIAEQAFRCYQAGASIAHIHAIDEKTKLTTADTKVFREIFTRIRAKCDMLIEITGAIGSWRDPATGKRTWASDEQRMALLNNVDPKPDMMPTPMGTMDYIYPDGYSTFPNTPDFLKKIIPAIIHKKIGWVAEIFEVGWLYNTLRLAEEGAFDKNMPFLINYCMNTRVLTGGQQPNTPRHLVYVSEEGKRLFPNSTWTMLTREPCYYQLITLGMSLGCHVVRVGYEDYFRLPNGDVAAHNAQLVESVVRIAKDLGREIATVDETKEILSLPGK